MNPLDLLRRCLPGIFLLCGILMACRKDKLHYAMEGGVYSARNGSAIPDVSLNLTQQQIENGSYNSNYLFAASDMTDASGAYSMEWKRENVVEFHLEVQKAGYIGQEADLSPELFSTESAYLRNVYLFPEAFIEVQILNEAPSSDTDFLGFRFDDAEFDCTCCTDAWKDFSGAQTDTLFSCRLYGDQYLKYIRHIITPQLDTLLSDSIWCPAFETTSLTISY